MMRENKNLTIQLLCVILILSCGLPLLAQQGPPRGGPPPGFPGRGDRRGPPGQRPPFGGDAPPGSEFRFLSSEMRFGEKTVKGAPFSALAVTESVQTLENGTKLTRKLTALLVRDGEGRTRREQDMGRVGPFASSNESVPVVFINDPVAATQYVLDINRKVASKMRFSAGAPPLDRQPPSAFETRTETLGKQTIEGVEAEGTRSTTTIPAGQIGNDRAIEIISERWYSPALQTSVMTRHSDPRLGTTTYRLTMIKRDEPDRALFMVPAEYRIEDTPNPGPDRRRRRRFD